LIHPRRVRDLYEVNTEGTRRVLAAAADAGIRRAVIMSSNSPLGCNPHPDHLFDEASPYHPYMHYGRSKMQMEKLVSDVQRSGRIETVVIRAPWFYGPYQPPRQTRFFEMIRLGRAPIVGSGENRRSMTYIGNLAQGLLLAAMTPQAKGRVYWIADERPYTMHEIVDTVERLLENEFGVPCRKGRLKLPSLASEVAWLADRGLQALGLYNQEIHVLSEMNKTIACSIARAREELGYSPAIALEEGMRRSLAWLARRGELPAQGRH
jgi:nucleoside-diphosphate-sugar epimerase